MVLGIGLVALSGLIWLLVWSLAGESESERRRLLSGTTGESRRSKSETDRALSRAA